MDQGRLVGAAGLGQGQAKQDQGQVGDHQADGCRSPLETRYQGFQGRNEKEQAETQGQGEAIKAKPAQGAPARIEGEIAQGVGGG